jgi:hypothetical protein
MDELEKLFEFIKTGKLNGNQVSGYWIDDDQKWLCPECLEDFLNRIAPCVDEKEFELFNNECDSCGKSLIEIVPNE